MEESNSGMHGHGMPATTQSNYTTKKTKKTKKQANEKDATMYKVSDNDTLFAMVKTEEGIIICCGRYRVSNKTFNSYEQAEAYIATKPYELLINVSVLFTKLNDNETKNENPQDK